jgi:hypothetical protein
MFEEEMTNSWAMVIEDEGPIINLEQHVQVNVDEVIEQTFSVEPRLISLEERIEKSNQEMAEINQAQEI